MVVKNRHVVVAGKELESLDRHLNINVRIPWENLQICQDKAPQRLSIGFYLAVPPPAHQRAMHQPCFGAYILHGEEVCLYESGQVGLFVLIAELSVGEPGTQGQPCSAKKKSGIISHRPS